MPIFEIEQNKSIKSIHLKIRDKNVSLGEFRFYSDRLIRIVLEKCFEFLPYKKDECITPIGNCYEGYILEKDLIGVSIIRAGESMESEFNKIMKNLPIAKILVQRNKESKEALFFYKSLPNKLSQKSVIIFEPMIATGNSIFLVLDKLISEGAKIENIIIANILCSPHGRNRILTQYPELKIVTSSIEQGMNENSFMIPGIGDFGDRYFGIKS
ncbi:uracil phosphoribosyltransferase [Acinetobacter sp. AM]|uniref:uracil phosphoribosyltransferase n=1 Tax=Acinetobacter sp. AM TaxID=2170730 RepID=UPI000DE72B3D|nr:uracil phosphoribosyltransferase [Acinetobacter sp. AM]PWB12996.1 uracil phosphoribosyltransferase [Acinetobacter sp. AM]